MRPVFQFGRRAGQPRRLQHLLVTAAALAVALRYCRMAQRDEGNGFPCTAALEWRKAADLCGPFYRVADHCWHQWERIMGMPRRLAAPLGVAAPAAEHTVSYAEVKASCPFRRFAALRHPRLSVSTR